MLVNRSKNEKKIIIRNDQKIRLWIIQAKVNTDIDRKMSKVTQVLFTSLLDKIFKKNASINKTNIQKCQNSFTEYGLQSAPDIALTLKGLRKGMYLSGNRVLCQDQLSILQEYNTLS